MSIHTKGECFARLMEHLRKAQEESANIAHLENANDHTVRAKDWLQVSENFKLIQGVITKLATAGLQ